MMGSAGSYGWKGVFIVIGFFLLGILGLFVAGGVIMGLVWVLSSKDIWVLGSLSLAFTIGTLVEMGQMERTRKLMQAVTGADFGDNQWGFGQVVSLFLWVPICVQASYYVISESSTIIFFQNKHDF